MSSSSSGAAPAAAAVGPGDEAQRARARRRSTTLGELLVVDDRARLLALADRRDLRPRERRVEKQRARAELRARDGRLDEAAVVAAQDRDAVARDEAGVAPGARERVRAPVHVGERQRAALVDDRDVAGLRIAATA